MRQLDEGRSQGWTDVAEGVDEASIWREGEAREEHGTPTTRLTQMARGSVGCESRPRWAKIPDGGECTENVYDWYRERLRLIRGDDDQALAKIEETASTRRG